MSLTDTRAVLTRTGGNYTDDGSDVSDGTYRPKVVHLGQYVPPGCAYFIPSPPPLPRGLLDDGSNEYIDSSRSAIPRAASPLAISLDRRGHHRNIRL